MFSKQTQPPKNHIIFTTQFGAVGQIGGKTCHFGIYFIKILVQARSCLNGFSLPLEKMSQFDDFDCLPGAKKGENDKFTLWQSSTLTMLRDGS